jgi:polyketide synthase PksL/polyketide synthase PksN
VLFSSVAAVTGNLGQSDYAFGNGHLDGFALHRARLVQRGERAGRTLSVDWPLWDGGGMTVPDPVRTVLREQVGMVPLPLARGIAAFERLLATPEAETSAVTCLFHGDVAVWRRHLAAHGVLAPQVAAAPPVTRSLVDAVIGRVAEVLGLPAGDLSAQTRVEALGLDSLMIRNLVADLSRSIAPIGPEALYGARDLGGLAALLAPGSAAAPADQVAAAPEGQVAAGSGDRGTVAAAAPARSDAPAVPARPGGGGSRRRPRPSGGGDRGPADIAIVGLAGRYPGAPDLATFWQNLVDGRDTVADPPAGRWADDAGVAVRAHFLDGVDRFDPEFFGVSEFDAALSDPQERLMLEVAWQALEDAGYAGRRLDALRASDGQPRAVGVFAGVTSADYQLLGAEQWARGGRTVPGGHAWSVANRVSYLFDLHGPSQPVDTACSSALVALHLASESIRRGECAAAIVGGVNLYLHPSRFLMLRRSGFLAEDGRCRGFGTGGAGFGPGEGAGAVLLRPLADAVAAGDRVHGVLLGSAVAHGGRTNGYTAPSPVAQARVIRQALAAAA